MSHSVRSESESFCMKESCPSSHTQALTNLCPVLSQMWAKTYRRIQNWPYDLPGVVRQTHLEWSLNICWQVCAKVYCTWSEHSPCPLPCSFNKGWKELWQKGTTAGLSLGWITTRKLDGEKPKQRRVSSPFPLITEQPAFRFILKWKTVPASLNMYVP